MPILSTNPGPMKAHMEATKGSNQILTRFGGSIGVKSWAPVEMVFGGW